MNIFKQNIKIRITTVIIVSLIVAIIIFSILYVKSSDTKISAILGSLIAGLIVAIIQFLIAWQDYKQTEKLKELDLIEILFDRDNRTFYEEYINNSKRKIDMMGVTASRFFKDFADDSPNATSNAKVLINALKRNVKVRVLLPDAEFVDENKKQDVIMVKSQVTAIKMNYPNCFLDVKYFKHVAAHSVFNVDDKCIVGPVFPEVESKYTPALFLRNSSPLAHKYLKYFEYEWNKAEQ